MRTASLVALSFVFSACAERTDVPLLLDPGEHFVGYTEQEVVYDPGDGVRSLRLAVWYPSPVEQGEAFLYDNVFPAVDVVEDTPVAEGSFPLVVFSHGHQGFAESSSRILGHMVRHGTIVVAPDHTDNLVFDGDNRTTDIYWKRPADLSAVLDYTLDPSFSLAGSIAPDAPILGMGHSFGGYTIEAMVGARFATSTLFPACAAGDDSAFCSTLTPADEARFEEGFLEPRLDGAITMAPGDHRLFGDAGLAEIDRPVLLATGGLDDVEQGDLQWSGLANEGNYRLHLETAAHLTFTDFAPRSEPNLAPATAFSVLGAYAVAFHRSLDGDKGARRAFDGSQEALDPTVVLSIGE